MDNKQFHLLTKELNLEYRELFGYIPRIIDYSCTREAYINALNKAVTNKKELSFYLRRVHVPRECLLCADNL